MARDGALTVLIPVMGGSIRFVLQRGIESEIEQFIHHLNEIKARGKLANVFVFWWYNTLGRKSEPCIACVRPKKNMCISGFPTLPSFWHPTLNFFLNRFTRFRRKSSDSAKEKIGKTI